MEFGAKIKLSVDTSGVGAFRSQIQSYVDRCSKNIKLRISDVKVDTPSLQKQLSSLKGITVRVDKIDASSAISGLRSQLKTMLSGLQISGLKDFVNADDATSSARKAAQRASQSVSQVFKTLQRNANNAFAYGNKLTDSGQIQKITTDYAALCTAINQAKTLEGEASQSAILDIAEKTAAMREYIDSIYSQSAAAEKAAAAEERSNKTTLASLQQINSLYKRINTYVESNPRVMNSPAYANAINNLQSQLASGGGMTTQQLAAISNEFAGITTQARDAGLEGKRFGDIISGAYQKFGGWMIITQTLTKVIAKIREMISNVIELNSAMTELKKVTDLSDNTYSQVFDNAITRAKTYGATVSDTINATADFSRLGYNIKDSEMLADSAIIYKNVGDGIDNISEASESIISTMKAFSIQASDSMSIVDKFNAVGNNFAISSKGVGDAMQRSSAALAAAGNTIDESIALAVGMNTVIQNPEKVGTTLKTASMYLRAAETDLEAAGEATDGMAGSVSELRGELLALTKNKVDIMADETTFKSTIQIYRELANVWGELADVDRANILELIGGKRNATANAALLSNFAEVEKALKVSQDAAGSAAAENERYLDSIQGKINVLKAAFEELSSNVFSEKLIGGAVETLTKVLDTLNQIVKTAGTLPTVVGAITAALSVMGKSAGIFSSKPGEQMNNPFTWFMPLINGRSISGIVKDFKSLKGVSLGTGINSIFSSAQDNSNLIALKNFSDAINSGIPKVQAYKQYISGLGQETRQAAVQIASGSKTVKDFSNGLGTFGIKAKLASVATTALNVALNMLITMGIAAAIQGIISGFDKLIHYEEKSAEKAKEVAAQSREAAETQAERSASLVDLVTKYEQLANSDVQNASTRAEIASVQSQIVALVGDEASSLDLVNGKLDEQLSMLQDISNVEIGKTISSLRKAYNDASESAKKAVMHEGNMWNDMFESNNVITFDDSFKSMFSKSYTSEGLQIIDKLWKSKGYGSAGTATKEYDLLGLVWDDYSRLELNSNLSMSEKIKAIDEAIAALEANQDIDFTNTELWSKLTEAREKFGGADSEYSKQVKAASEFLDRLAESEVGSGKKINTYDEYVKYRQDLIDKLADDQTIKRAMQEGVLNEDKVIGAVDGYLATLEKYSDFYAKWQEDMSGITNAQSEQIKKAFSESNSVKEAENFAAPFKDGATKAKQQIDQFNRWVDNLSDSDRSIAYDISLTTDTSSWSLDDWNSQLNELRNNSSALDTLRAKAQAVRDVANDKISFKIDVELEGVEGLQSAMEESVSSTGLMTESIDAVRERYSKLAEYNPNELFEKTANGVHLNTEALRELENSYEGTRKAYLDTALDEQVDKYNELTAKIEECTSAHERAGLLNERSQLASQIEETALLAAQYEGLTSAYQKWVDAQSMGEEGDMYDNLRDSLESIKELYDTGLVGTNEFRAAAQLMTNKDLSGAGIEEIVAAYEKGYPLMQRYFTDGAEGCQRFLTDVSKLNSEWAHMNEDGTWEINFGVGNDQDIADALGINVDTVQTLLRKLSDYGFDIDLDSVLSDLGLLKDEVEAANDKLKELGATDIDFDVNTDDIKSIDSQIKSAKSVLDQFRSSDGSVNLELEGASEAQTVLASLIARKQELNAPAVMSVDTSEATSGVEQAIALLQEFQTATNNLEIDTEVGADTSSAQTEVDALTQKIQGIDANILATLGIDPTSTATIEASISALTPELIVQAGVDPSKVDAYIGEEKKGKGTVKWENDTAAVDKFKNTTQKANGKVKWENDTTNVKTSFSATGTITWSDSGKSKGTKSTGKNGDGAARGTAFKNGTWGARNSGVALGGELGQELVVRNGKFFTVGDYSTEFFRFEKGDIVFNAEQTKQILEKGKIISGNKRGKALAEGNAFSSGSGAFIVGGEKQTTTVSSNNNKTAATTTTKTTTPKTANTVQQAAKNTAKSVSKSAEDAFKDMAEEFKKKLDVFEHKAFMLERGNAPATAIVAIYQEAQQAVHDQAELYRQKGLDEDSEYIRDMEEQWWTYQDEISEVIDDVYEKQRKVYENVKDMNEIYLDNAIRQNNREKVSESILSIINMYQAMQNSLHEQASYYRELGYAETSDQVAELSKLWWEYEDNIVEAVTKGFEQSRDAGERTIELLKTNVESGLGKGEYEKSSEFAREIVAAYRQLQTWAHEQADYYRALGYADTSEEVSELSKLWWEYEGEVGGALESIYNGIYENSKQSFGDIKSMFDTLKTAAEDYVTNGGLTIDTFEKITELGIEYLSYLKDENGMLVVNKERVERAVAAKTKQLAVETALSYVEELRAALLKNDTRELNRLVEGIDDATDATWGLVYANLAMLDLDPYQYKQAFNNINKLRDLSRAVVDEISYTTSTKDMQDALGTILDLTMDLIKYEADEKIDALNEQIDKYRDIINLKKESIKASKTEDDYEKDVAKKVAEIAKLQSRINQLSLDDSRAAQAERKSLEEELSELQTDLADYQADYSYDRQIEMLDDELDAYEKSKRKQIDIVEDSVSSTQKLYELAIDRIDDDWDTLYDDIIDWNYEAGNSIQSEIVEAWNLASKAVEEYGTYVKAVKNIEAGATTVGESHQDSYTDPKPVIAQMKANSLAWYTAPSSGQATLSSSNKQLAKQLSSIYGKNVVSKNGDWYLDGSSTPLYTLDKWEIVDYITKAMRTNSAKWSSASDAERSTLESLNERMAQYIQTLSGQTVRKDGDGVWWIGNDRLYDSYGIYHTGGVVGGHGSFKDNEALTLLENGEVVLDQPKKNSLYKYIDIASYMLEKFGSAIGNISGIAPTDPRELMGGIGNLNADKATALSSIRSANTECIIESLSVEAPIQVVQELNEATIRKYSKTIGALSADYIKAGFTKRGIGVSTKLI